MKRLIMVSMMFMSGLVQAEDTAVPPAAPVTIQSPNDASSKSDEDSISIANVHHIDLDTTEVDGGGNWLNKRIWYQKSQAIFDEIRAMVSTVGDIRIQFSDEVNAIGKKIDSFWETVDYNKGQLDDKFKEILTMLDTEQKMLGDLSPDERNLQTAIKQELTVIDQIGKDIKAIHEVDDKIDQTLMQAFKTIDECRVYETKAWDSFKAIGKELDDKKARNLYYQMDNYKQNIDQKNNYLKSTLLPYLHNVLVAKVEMNISKINDAVEKLKAKGIDLEKIMSKSQDDDIIQLHAREKSTADIAVKKALEEEQAKSKEAADKAAKALEEANQKSFSNVMHRYYEATIGKIVGFVHQGFVGASIDSVVKHVKSYSFPVATHVHHGVVAVRVYMQDLVQNIMIYFGGKRAVKAAIAEKIVEKMENKDHLADAIKEKIAEKVNEHHDAAAKAEDKVSETKTPEVKADVALVVAAPTTAVVNVDKTPEAAVTPSPSIPAEASTTPVVSALVSTTPVADASVAVQAMKNDDDNNTKPESENSFYKVFTTILDLIGTVIMSVYNCILQFFKLLMSFSAYVMSGN
jgi:hypothetical protein